MVTELRTSSQLGRHHVVLQLPSDLGLKGTSTATIVQGAEGPALYINGRAVQIALPEGTKIGDRVQVALRADGRAVITLLATRNAELEAALRVLASLRAVLPMRPVAVPERVSQQAVVGAHDLATKENGEALRAAIAEVLQRPLSEVQFAKDVRVLLERGGAKIDALLKHLEVELAPKDSRGAVVEAYKHIDPLLNLLRTVPNATGIPASATGDVANLLLNSHLNFSLQQVERVRDILRSIGDDQTVQVLLKIVSALDRLLVAPVTDSDREMLLFLRELRNFLESKPQGEVLRKVLQSYLDTIIEKYVAPQTEPRVLDLSPRFARALLVLATNLETTLQQLQTTIPARALAQDATVTELLAMVPNTATEERIQTALRTLVERVNGGAAYRESVQRFIDEHVPFDRPLAISKSHLAGIVLHQAVGEELQRLGGVAQETTLLEMPALSLAQGVMSYQKLGPPQIADLLKDYSVRLVLSLVAERRLPMTSEEPLEESFLNFMAQAARNLPAHSAEHPKEERAVIRQGLERLKELFLEERRSTPLVKEVREDQRMLQVLESASQAQELLTRMLPLLPQTQTGSREGVLLLPLFAFGMLQLVQIHHARPSLRMRAEHEEETADQNHGDEERIQFEVEFAMLGRIEVVLSWRPGSLRARLIVGHESIKKLLSRRLSVVRLALLRGGLTQVDLSVWARRSDEGQAQ